VGADIYSAEKLIVRALPRMAKAAESQELKQAFTKHLNETKGHAQLLGYSEAGKLLQ
jgi:ferritin-like metal-binding protein YciE